MATLSSLGIGSGIDTASLLDTLKYGEQQRLVPYTNMQASYQGKISAWGMISSSLDTLNKSVKPLQGDAFNTLNASTHKSFVATANPSASADVHDVKVTQLATAHKLGTKEPQKSSTEQLGGEVQNGGPRTLVIEQADGSMMEVELKDDETSLDQIAKAINKQDGDVRASVQRTDTDYVLVLSSKNTGKENAIKSVEVKNDKQLDDILNSKNLKEISPAKNAELKVDGIEYVRSTNNINDIIPGVTFELKAVSEEPEMLTLTKDTTQYNTSIKSFVDSYNALLTQTNAASKYVPSESTGLGDNEIQRPSSDNGALVGDSLLRGMMNEIRYTVNGVYGENGAEYSSLADIGIKIDPATGMMTLDETKLDAAIAANPEDVANIFMDKNGNQGLASKLNGIIVSYAGDPEAKIDGSIKGATDTLNEQVDLIKIQIEKTQKLIDAQVERYRVQFQNLDKTMASLNSTANQMGALLSTLSAN